MTLTDRTPLTMTFKDHLQHLVESALASIARQTEAANPPGLADKFTSWVRNG